jgi:hypothetical protein
VLVTSEDKSAVGPGAWICPSEIWETTAAETEAAMERMLIVDFILMGWFGGWMKTCL